jgi:deoxyadenosine/deoxycytidine kinase
MLGTGRIEVSAPGTRTVGNTLSDISADVAAKAAEIVGAAPEDPLHIVVAGDIASGKTTLTTALARELGLKAWCEKPERNPFLARYYDDEKRWALTSQLWFTIETAAQHRALHRAGGGIQDHSVYENVYVFGAMMAETGVLAPDEWALLRDIGETVIGELPAPSAVLLLVTPVRQLLQRIGRRSRAYELNISRGYLQALVDVRRNFFAHWQLAPVIPIDTTRYDPRRASDVTAIAELVRTKLRPQPGMGKSNVRIRSGEGHPGSAAN